MATMGKAAENTAKICMENEGERAMGDSWLALLGVWATALQAAIAPWGRTPKGWAAIAQRQALPTWK